MKLIKRICAGILSATTLFGLLPETAQATPPVATILCSKGGAIPGAGILGSGIPAGAVWRTFSVPSINESGQAVVKAVYKVGSINYTGIFAFDTANIATMKLIARSGTPVPGISGVNFGAMKDPILGPDGAVAWTAALSGSTAVNLAIFLDPDGAGALPAQVVARKGAAATGSAVWKNFTSIAIGDQAIAFTGMLKPNVGGVTASNDSAMWIYDRNLLTTTMPLREGAPLLGSTVKIIAALIPAPGSPGQGRGWLNGFQNVSKARVTLADLRHTICGISKNGAVFPFYTTGGEAQEYGAGATWRSFGLPTQSTEGGAAFLGTVEPLTGSATTQNNVAIFAEEDGFWYSALRVVKKNDITGVPNGVFSSFLDPVNKRLGEIAFIGSMEFATGITNLNNEGIWLSNHQHNLRLVAREGSSAAGTTGPVWKAFTSLAFPEYRGPLFVASLKGPGVTTANDIGLWATDSTGILQLALREGSAIGGKTVKSFVALSTVVGSPAQTRSFNSSGHMLIKMTDTQLAQHLVLIQVQ